MKNGIVATVVASSLIIGAVSGSVVTGSLMSSKCESVLKHSVEESMADLSELKMECEESRLLMMGYRSIIRDMGVDMGAVDSEAVRRSLK